ncbi:hypothetical protein R6Q57_009318 [Mikania cordata]
MLVLEFCSTFQFDHQAKNLTDEKAITFQLGGKSHNMSIARLGKLMGSYKENELCKNLFKKGLQSLERTASHELWSEIGTRIYKPRATKRTQMKDPLHCYIHGAISNTISAREFSTSVVSARDIFFMYCLIRHHPNPPYHYLVDLVVDAELKLQMADVVEREVGEEHNLLHVMLVIAPATSIVCVPTLIFGFVASIVGSG